MSKPLTVCLLDSASKPGDQPPQGYGEWHEWARVQYRAGLRQARCSGCGKYRFPQQRCREGERL